MVDRDQELERLFVSLEEHVREQLIESEEDHRYRVVLDSSRNDLDMRYYQICLGTGVGVAYYDESLETPLGRSIVGRSASSVWPEVSVVTRIALLDALMNAVDCKQPVRVVEADGSVKVRGQKRAEVVVQEARELCNLGSSLLVVGSVSNIIDEAVASNHFSEINVVDLSSHQIGRIYSGLVVESGSGRSVGSETLKRIQDSDVAIVTGMAFVNDTLHGIVKESKQSSCKLVVYAQSARNILRHFAGMDLERVIAEEWPFYLVPGCTSRLVVY